jgi:hypothetical protein
LLVHLKVTVGIAICVSLFVSCNRQRDNGFRLASSGNPNTAGSSTAPSNPPALMPVASYADIVAKATPAVVTMIDGRVMGVTNPVPAVDTIYTYRGDWAKKIGFSAQPKDARSLEREEVAY